MDFINQSTQQIAKNLLGKLLIHKTQDGTVYAGYIVETEAYLGIKDAACHSYLGKRTPKLAPMYQLGGTIYLYTMHTHRLLNIVTQEEDVPEGVLIRGIQPITNLEKMQINRGKEGVLLTNGPGKITQAFQIPKELNGKMLGQESGLFLDETRSRQPKEWVESQRIGIPNKGVWTKALLRFYVAGHPYVSLLKKKEWQSLEKVWLN